MISPIIKTSVKMQPQIIVTHTKDLTHLKYGSLSKWSLYSNFIVKYEWHCPEKDSPHKKERDIDFENLPLEIQILIAKEAIKTPLLKILDDEKQLILVHLAVIDNK